MDDDDYNDLRARVEAIEGLLTITLGQLHGDLSRDHQDAIISGILSGMRDQMGERSEANNRQRLVFANVERILAAVASRANTRRRDRG